MWSARVHWLKPAAALGVLLLFLSGCLAAALNEQDTAAPRTRSSTGTQSRTLEAAAPSAGSVTALSDRLVVLSQAGSEMRIRLLQPSHADSTQGRPAGFLSPDGSTLRAGRGHNKTTVHAYDLESGRELRHTVLEGQYFVPDEIMSQTQLAISGDGRRLLLKRVATESQLKTWQANGQPHSEFAVLDTDFRQPPVQFDLPGEFWFAARSAVTAGGSISSRFRISTRCLIRPKKRRTTVTLTRSTPGACFLTRSWTSGNWSK